MLLFSNFSKALRDCIARGTPYGSERWQKQTSRRLGLESSLRPRSPSKEIKKVACPLFLPVYSGLA